MNKIDILKKYNKKYALSSFQNIEDEVIIKMVKSMCDIEIPKILNKQDLKKYKKIDKLNKELWRLIPSAFVQAMQDNDIGLATKNCSFKEWWWGLTGMFTVLIHIDRQKKKVIEIINKIYEIMEQGEER